MFNAFGLFMNDVICCYCCSSFSCLPLCLTNKCASCVSAAAAAAATIDVYFIVACDAFPLHILNPHHVQLITSYAFVKIIAYNAVIGVLYYWETLSPSGFILLILLILIHFSHSVFSTIYSSANSFLHTTETMMKKTHRFLYAINTNR